MHSPAPSSASRQSGFAALRQHGGDVHIVDRLRGLMRYRWVAAGVFGAVLLASGLYSWSETPMYRAGARILLELEDERSLAVEGVGSTQNTEYTLDPEPY